MTVSEDIAIHLAVLAPHNRQRLSARLLAAAKAEIDRLEKVNAELLAAAKAEVDRLEKKVVELEKRLATPIGDEPL